jgi:hypothetical protein
LAPGLASLISLGKVRFLHIVPVKYVLAIGNLLAKIRDVKKLSQKMWCHFPSKSDSLNNFITLSVDEALVGTKARSVMTRYIPTKSHKLGIKLWVLVEAVSGYIIHLSLLKRTT